MWYSKRQNTVETSTQLRVCSNEAGCGNVKDTKIQAPDVSDLDNGR